MTRIVLDVTLYPQETNEWCWAASGQMVMAYWGSGVTQCEEANELFNLTDCCDTPTPTACINPGSPQFAAWGFDGQVTAMGVALTFAALTNQFTLGQPVTYSWRWVKGGGHVMVGCGVDTATNMVYINNPWPPNTGDTTWISYANYVSQSGKYTHGRDWYDITPSSPPSSPPASAGDDMTDSADDDGSPGAAQFVHHDVYGAASAGLSLLRQLPLPGAPTELGGDQLALGEPLRIHNVFRDSLAERTPEQDPEALLVDGNELFFPVLGGDGVVAAVRVVGQGGMWAVKSVGEPNLARDVASARAADARASNTPESRYFIVDVPALYAMFIARVYAVGPLVLVPVHDDPAHGFSRTVPVSAAEAFNRLTVAARRARERKDSAGGELLFP